MTENINNDKSFIEIEDELNTALKNIEQNKENRTESITVQELLEDLKIDEFEKIYVITANQSNIESTQMTSKNQNKNNEIKKEQIEKIQTLAEYKLSQMLEEEKISQIENKVSEEEKKKLETISNFYLIPQDEVNRKYHVGDNEKVEKMERYVISDVEGHNLYNVINNKDVYMCKDFEAKIRKYLEQKYHYEVESGIIEVDEVVDNFTPKNMSELYDMLGDENILSMRFLPDRIDDFMESKGLGYKDNQNLLDEKDNVNSKNLKQNRLEEKSQSNIDLKKNEQTLENNKEETLEDNLEKGEIADGASIKLKEESKVKVESYIEKIARINHVNPAVVNTRVIDNFEKVEEDTGIHLKGRYRRGDVIAVRLPYKLTYRTFLVDKNTGMTIDGKGRMDRKTGRLYDFNEIEDYFRFKSRAGHDGGENGKALRKDEGRDYATYINEYGEIKEEKFVNNGSKEDMMREERQRYLTESSEIDRKLKDAIEEYQKHATHENYQRVRDIIKDKVNVDNKYNALDKQRELTEKTIKNVEKIVEDKTEDDDWFPTHEFGRYRY